jgi:hypothetical protein
MLALKRFGGFWVTVQGGVGVYVRALVGVGTCVGAGLLAMDDVY